MIYNRIWIPSAQQFIRLRDISFDQYKDIHRAILSEDEDFIFCINNILAHNLYIPYDISSNWNILDRLVAIIQLKIHSCNDKLSLKTVCDKCESSTTVHIDLNTILNDLSTKIDKSFRKTYGNNPSIICDIPSIRFNDSRPNITDDNIWDHYLFSFIRGIIINKNIIDLDSYSYEDRLRICGEIKYETLTLIKKDFINPIHETCSDTLLTAIPCSGKSCTESIKIQFSISNITDIIRVFFKDDSLENVLYTQSNLSSQLHFDQQFYENSTPMEIRNIEQIVKSQNTSEASRPEQTDLFNDQMVESPSEFV